MSFVRAAGAWLVGLQISASCVAGEGPAPATNADFAQEILVTLVNRPAAPLRRAGSARKVYAGAGRYEVAPAVRRAARRLASTYDLEAVQAWPIEVLGVHCVVYRVPDGRPRAEVVALLERDPNVETVQPMQLFHARAARYDDPYLALQTGVASLQIEQAHRFANGRGVTVAVIDTGVAVQHPELAGRVRHVADFVDDDTRVFRSDIHGTAVAGIIAAAAGNGVGIIGVAPEVTLDVLQACWSPDPRRDAAICSSLTLAKALAKAFEIRSDVVNLSLSGPADPLLERLLQRVSRRGTPVVAAFDQEHPGDDRFPAPRPGIILVDVAGSSSPALTLLQPPHVVAAPGREVLTTMPGDAFDFRSGSSIAAAHVSGVVALLRELDAGLSAEQIHAHLQRTAPIAPHDARAARVVNACLAVTELLGVTGCTEQRLASY